MEDYGHLQEELGPAINGWGAAAMGTDLVDRVMQKIDQAPREDRLGLLNSLRAWLGVHDIPSEAIASSQYNAPTDQTQLRLGLRWGVLPGPPKNGVATLNPNTRGFMLDPIGLGLCRQDRQLIESVKAQFDANPMNRPPAPKGAHWARPIIDLMAPVVCEWLTEKQGPVFLMKCSRPWAREDEGVWVDLGPLFLAAPLDEQRALLLEKEPPAQRLENHVLPSILESVREHSDEPSGNLIAFKMFLPSQARLARLDAEDLDKAVIQSQAPRRSMRL